MFLKTNPISLSFCINKWEEGHENASVICSCLISKIHVYNVTSCKRPTIKTFYVFNHSFKCKTKAVGCVWNEGEN